MLQLLFFDAPGLGDRVAICSRNYPEYLVAFWASRKCIFLITHHVAILTIDIL